ncbi:hypothetical protein WSM22_18270 [Cytophagales bacterium WSM2-2]|nr:hypothetical protein WSM22_18270 [Cytophagales bacterium WSM2-2]
MNHELREPIKPIFKGANNQILSKAEVSPIMPDRVVNTWFELNHEAISRHHGLSVNTDYSFVIQIGRPLQKSNVQVSEPFPHKPIAPFLTDNGILLDVKLYTNDFIIEKSVDTLKLFPPPSDSAELRFSLRTKSEEQSARLRVGIYFRNNLIQSLIVKAVISNYPPSGSNSARVDFSLTTDLVDFEHLTDRAINIATNYSGVGTHSFFVSGSQINRQFDFSEGQINSAAAAARRALENICFKKNFFSKRQYLYTSDNTGSLDKLRKDIITLASCGLDLYSAIVISDDWDFHKQLSAELQIKRTIQVASTDSARFVFPWAMVYDKRLGSDNLSLCDLFEEDLREKNPIRCFAGSCAHNDNSKVVCPSRFWGFRHIIEQPVSLTKDKALQLHPRQITVPGGNASMAISVNTKLSRFDTHEKDLASLAKLNRKVLKSKDELLSTLEKQEDHAIIYFYCHGKRDRFGGYLSIGNNECFKSRDLIGITLNHSPFVFINGCETVGFTPDDLVDFNSNFTACRASGIMGTEISIPEILAAHFASGFFKYFLSGKTVGESLYEQRHQMLRDKNLLGLAYTPYCLSNLHLTYTNSSNQ